MIDDWKVGDDVWYPRETEPLGRAGVVTKATVCEVGHELRVGSYGERVPLQLACRSRREALPLLQKLLLERVSVGVAAQEALIAATREKLSAQEARLGKLRARRAELAHRVAVDSSPDK